MLSFTDDSTTTDAWKAFFALMKSILNEKHYRLLLGGFVLYILGNAWGSISRLSELTGTCRDTISKGRKEIQKSDPHICAPRVRRAGGGRKRSEERKPGLLKALERILIRESYGNPQNEKGRICSAMSLQKILQLLPDSLKVCCRTILKLVRQLGYSKQQNKKALQCGKPHPDRNEQMQIIQNEREFMLNQTQNPVISVDAKAKVFFNRLFQNGRQWRKQKDPLKVLDHDFPKKDRKAVPYGVYDLIHGKGFVNLGLGSDTAQFAAESIRRWWKAVGAEAFPLAQYLTIFCDGGGSNGYRIHAWKYELAKLADEIGIPIIVHHYPTGCSKFNPVEHRLFNILSMNWAGQAFEDIQTVIRYIHSARTQTGLTVKVRPDQCVYEKGIKIPQDEIDRIIMIEGKRLPSWNYMIVGLAESFTFPGAA